MNKIVITIEQIKQNPNLDLSERVNMYLKDEKFSLEDAKELALATIKQEYEFWINNRTNICKRTDELIQKLLNGHFLNKSEEFEMICDDKEKIAEYSKYEILKNKIQKSNGITQKDFEQLCSVIGFDIQLANVIKTEFEQRGLIIEQYSKEDEYHKQI